MRKLNKNEKKLIEILLDKHFIGRDIIIEQLKDVMIIPSYEQAYISLKFIVNNQNQRFPYKLRVPVEMVATHQTQVPIVIILHIINGYIDELEIFNADSSPINKDINFANFNFEIKINDNLIIN